MQLCGIVSGVHLILPSAELIFCVGLCRSPGHKIYPAMYIDNITELAYDDVAVEDPDFPYIQGYRFLYAPLSLEFKLLSARSGC